MSVAPSTLMTTGMVFVHSTPVALCPHIGWALDTVLGQPIRLDWQPQRLGRSLMRAQFAWGGEAGTGARLASVMRAWESVRFEVTEDASPGCDGSRWCHTPSLGIHHTWLAANGDAVVNEDRLRAVLRSADGPALREELDRALGTAWDAELDPFRHAGDGAPTRWLYRVS
ncbi:DUF3145 domain-containing protein [Mobilicoccus pelagius]|uniref:DUF3145 domain-containing protein n=1 Tax=Mobilicoccus pelagius NBRC 104925 TaxID=1089455 RepID=H5UQ01_9MICO|nr:DUF3145 domain-containing protein [Mobilicoccus pelagius]GAB47806.1 hypothetical protein MOPEL_029_00870 [Mobilicoccus pelagius NBRC 104925]